MSTSRASLAAVFVSSAITLSMATFADAQARTVDIKAPDGVSLKASYFPAGKPGPGVLLLHQCGLTRHAWDDLAADLAAAGIHVLAFDYRGFGESKGKMPPPPPSPMQTGGKRPFSPTISGSWVGHTDVELAYQYLRSLEGVDRTRIAVGGASCGAAFAADLTIHHPDIRALVLLSGQISDAAAAHIASTSWLPVFGAAERGDMPTAYEGLTAAIATSKHARSVMKMYPGTKHGVEMFPDNPALRPLIDSWLIEALK
jgi:dienelactone hydrolase